MKRKWNIAKLIAVTGCCLLALLAATPAAMARDRSQPRYDPFERFDPDKVTTLQEPEKPNYQREITQDITKQNFIITENYSFTIEKDKTITLVEGATMTIYGTVVIKGTLINNGTIIIATSPTDREKGEFHGALVNEGTFQNNAAIEIKDGKLINQPLATLENAGTILVKITKDKMVGFSNMISKPDDEGQYDRGTVVNTGRITLQNTAGTGLRNSGGALFQNDGIVEMASEATIKGTLRGNPVQTLSQ